MLKISEFLEKFTFSHAIQTANLMQEEFEKQTGETFPLPTHSVKETRAAISARGLGGDCDGKPTDRVVWGYELASTLADSFGAADDRQYRNMLGRDSVFQAAIRSLKKAGN